jgi:hypothetical protein
MRTAIDNLGWTIKNGITDWPAGDAMPVSPTSTWPNGKAYFFKGAQYDRYDPHADKVDPGYPAPIAGNWRGLWDKDIDA